VPKFVTTYNDVLKCAGTRYSYSPNILAPTGKIMQKRNLAFVGTPCQIRAVRQMQLSKLSSWPRSVRLLVGLMCSECFSYERLMGEIVQEKLGADLNSVRKMNIKGRLFITHDSKTESISLAEVKKYSRTACKVCDDFSSELADLSVGGLGVNRWSFVVIRSKVGEEVFSRAVKAGCLRTRPVGKEDSALGLLVKLSNRKRMLKKLRQATDPTR